MRAGAAEHRAPGGDFGEPRGKRVGGVAAGDFDLRLRSVGVGDSDVLGDNPQGRRVRGATGSGFLKHDAAVDAQAGYRRTAIASHRVDGQHGASDCVRPSRTAGIPSAIEERGLLRGRNRCVGSAGGWQPACAGCALPRRCSGRGGWILDSQVKLVDAPVDFRGFDVDVSRGDDALGFNGRRKHACGCGGVAWRGGSRILAEIEFELIRPQRAEPQHGHARPAVEPQQRLAVAAHQLHRVGPAHFEHLGGAGGVGHGAQPAAAAASGHDAEAVRRFLGRQLVAHHRGVNFGAAINERHLVPAFERDLPGNQLDGQSLAASGGRLGGRCEHNRGIGQPRGLDGGRFQADRTERRGRGVIVVLRLRRAPLARFGKIQSQVAGSDKLVEGAVGMPLPEVHGLGKRGHVVVEVDAKGTAAFNFGGRFGQLVLRSQAADAREFAAVGLPNSVVEPGAISPATSREISSESSLPNSVAGPELTVDSDLKNRISSPRPRPRWPPSRNVTGSGVRMRSSFMYRSRVSIEQIVLGAELLHVAADRDEAEQLSELHATHRAEATG